MANAFNLTAQLNLRGPNNIKPVVGKIRKQLGSINTNVNLTLNKNASKTVQVVTNRLKAMNNVLVSSKSHVNELNASFAALSTSLGNVQRNSESITKDMSQVNKTAATSAKELKQAANAMEDFGKQSFLAVKRFAAFSIVSVAIYGVVNAIQSGFKAFVDFDRQLIRLQQVTGAGALGIKELSDEITNLAKNLGVSSSSLAEVSVTLAQAGLTARQTKDALAAIAKTDLAPTFDNMTDTTEGAIAAMRQFNIAAKDLEGTLGSINAVAASFAVESSDIIKAIQRAGSVFASSSKGVSTNTEALKEFIAVFTAVRSTTRESAETIATGLRTVFTRIQRPQTIKFLRQYGVELTDIEGKFVGPYEAAKRLSDVLGELDPRDLRFGQIVEELGGFRQINKVIPILQNFSTAQQALNVARKGSGSLTKAQEIAEQSLAVQLAKVREEFLALIKTVGQSKTFQTFFSFITKITSGLIKLAGVFKPILPALAILGTLKIGKAALSFGGGFLGSFKKGGGSKAAGRNLGETVTGTKDKTDTSEYAAMSEAIKNNTDALTTLTGSLESLTTKVDALIISVDNNTAGGGGGSSTLSDGGKVLGFNRGGVVPGSGKGDKVPAMLEPGEVVINNQAAQKYGRGNLVRMNKLAVGGYVKKKLANAEADLQEQAISYNDIDLLKINNSGKGSVKGYMFENYVGQKYGVDAPDQKFPDIPDASQKTLNQFDLSKTKGPTGQKIEHIELKYRSGLQPEFRDRFTEDNTAVLYAIDKASGGLVQKFMAGSPGGIQLAKEGRGKEGRRGAQDTFSPISTETYRKFAKKIYAEYDADPSLVKVKDELGMSLPPEIAFLNYLLGKYAFETGGAGMSFGKKFVRTPKEQIVPELKPYLVPDPSDPNEFGFFADDIGPFAKAKAKSMSEKQIANIGKEQDMANQAARIADWEHAYSSEWSKISRGGEVDKHLLSTLTGDVLTDYETARDKGAEALAKDYHRTRLRKETRKALENMGSEVDYSGDYISDSLIKRMAKDLSLGGLVQKFAEGGISELIGGPFPRNFEPEDGKSWRQILQEILQRSSFVLDDKNNIAVGDKVISLRDALSPRKLTAKNFRQKVGEEAIPRLESVRTAILSQYDAGKAEVERRSDFTLTDEEKAAAQQIAIAGIRSDRKDLAPFYRKRDGVPLYVHSGIIKEQDYADVEELWRQYYQTQMDAANRIAGRRGQTATPISEDERKTLGIANAQGYDLEVLLAALGSTGGKRNSQDAIDFAQGLSPLAASVFGVPAGIPTQAKLTINSKSMLDAVSGIVRGLAFGGRAEGPGFEEVKQQIIDKYPEIEFRISKRKRGFGYNLMGALKSAGGLSGDSSLNFQQPTNLKQLQEYADKIASKLMNPEQLAVGGSSSDTVPAMVSNNEGFVPPKLAQRIGYAKLDKMNQADRNGMTGFAEGGISKFKGPGSGTSDSIGPIGLPKGSYVIRAKAMEAMRLHKGGYVGTQRLSAGGPLLGGGRSLPEDVATAKALEIFNDAAERAGQSLQEFEKSTKKQIIALAQAKKAERVQTRESLKSSFLRQSGTGFADEDARKEYGKQTKKQIKSITGDQFDETQLEAAAAALANMAEQATSFEDVMSNTDPELRAFIQSMQDSNDSSDSLRQAEEELADQLGALTEAARATQEELEDIEFTESGEASDTLGLLGRLNPRLARDLQGSRSLSAAQSVTSGGRLGNVLSRSIDKLPAKISGPLKLAVKNIGGPSGALAVGASMIGDQLPQVFKRIGLGRNTTAAGVAGALQEGGSRAASMATIGNQIAGPLGAAIGLITGAISGAIDGFMKAARAKQLENSMVALDKASTKATEALEMLTSFDTEANFQEAAKATDVLRDSITDLGEQSKVGFSGVASGAIEGAGYGAMTGAMIGNFIPIPGVGAGIGAAVGAIVGGLIGGITSYFSSDEISEAAFAGQLKAIDSYVSGIQQLAERRINLQSLEDIDEFLNRINEAKTPEERARVAEGGFIVQEAQRAALLRQGAKIKQSDSVEDFVYNRGMTRIGEDGETVQDVAGQAKEDIAVAYAMRQLNQLYDGNKEAIEKEAADKEKLIKTGLELIAVEDKRMAKEAQMVLAMKAVNMQTEELIEKFRKMEATTQKFSDSLEMTQTRVQSVIAASSGQATSTATFRADEKILANPLAATDEEFSKVVSKVGALAGGGENSQQLVDTLNASRMVQTKLPDLLRGASQQNVGDVVTQLEQILKDGGISGQALTDVVKEVRESLEKETSGREGKGFNELLQDFPALQAAMKTQEAAVKTASQLLAYNNSRLQEYGNILDEINNATRRQIDIQYKADQIRLEYAEKLARMSGKTSEERLDTPVTNRVIRLTAQAGIGPTTDPTKIGNALRKAIEEQQKLQQQQIDEGASVELKQQQSEIADVVNNLSTALDDLANNTERTAQIMKEFEQVNRELNAIGSVGEKLLTSDPTQLSDFNRQQQNLSKFLSGDEQFEKIISRPENYQTRQDVFSALDFTSQFMSPEEAAKQRREITLRMLEMIPGGEEVKERIKKLQEEEEIKKKELEEAEKERQKALGEQIKVQNTLATALDNNKDTLKTSMSELTKAIDKLNKEGVTVKTEAETETSARNAESKPSASENTGFRREARRVQGRTSRGTRSRIIYVQVPITSEDAKTTTATSEDAKTTTATSETQAPGIESRRSNGTMPRPAIPTTSSGIDSVLPGAGARPRPTTTSRQGGGTMTVPFDPTGQVTLNPSTGLPNSSLVQTVSTTEQKSDIDRFFGNISSSNPLPVKVINVAEFKEMMQVREGSTTNPVEQFNMFTTTEAKAFLSDFTQTIGSFKTYIDNLQKIMNVPVRIDIVGRHTVDVRITGAAAFEALKEDFYNLIVSEVDKKMKDIWSKTGGQLGSPGGGSRAVQPQQYF